MSKSYVEVKCVTDVSSAIGDAFSALEELGVECREASDNFPNPDHPKAQAFAEAADVLEGLTEPTDVPDAVRDLPVHYFESKPRDKRRAPSRDVRYANACSALRGAVSALDRWLEENAEHPDHDDVEQLTFDLEGEMDRDVEFPRMFD